jgi:hypothetical protein
VIWRSAHGRARFIRPNAQGPVELATYRRFARGLNEPLGLKVLNNQIYIVQKCELTRLIDSDNNGEADRYESVNDDWGFSGNYHSFAFGPVIDRQNNFYVAVCGQRGRWDVPYVGWCMKISTDGERLEGVCSGLRAPNGLGFYGPDQDLFATDNEGNWLGACKLNHLQTGRYYGYPSGYPAPKEDYGRKKISAASRLVSEETRSVRERFRYNYRRSVRPIHRTDAGGRFSECRCAARLFRKSRRPVAGCCVAVRERLSLGSESPLDGTGWKTLRRWSEKPRVAFVGAAGIFTRPREFHRRKSI